MGAFFGGDLLHRGGDGRLMVEVCPLGFPGAVPVQLLRPIGHQRWEACAPMGPRAAVMHSTACPLQRMGVGTIGRPNEPGSPRGGASQGSTAVAG